MRIIFLITANLVLIATLALGDGNLFWDGNRIGEVFHASSKKLGEAADNYLYKKQINYSGNRRVNPKDLTKVLPNEKSIAWWLINQNSIESRLLENPLIADAQISACSYTEWGCFNVKIKERQPEYIAMLGNEPWLIGADGGFIAPLDNILDKKSGIKIDAKEVSQSVIIKGLLEKDYSPDVLQAKISFLSQAMATIEKKVKLKVQEAEINADSEIAIRFKGQDFLVRFTFADSSLVTIEDQSVRLKKILNEYSGRLNEVKEIDLAFEHIAVVKKAEVKKS